jgi:hypothetical protein
MVCIDNGAEIVRDISYRLYGFVVERFVSIVEMLDQASQ